MEREIGKDVSVQWPFLDSMVAYSVHWTTNRCAHLTKRDSGLCLTSSSCRAASRAYLDVYLVILSHHRSSHCCCSSAAATYLPKSFVVLLLLSCLVPLAIMKSSPFAPPQIVRRHETISRHILRRSSFPTCCWAMAGMRWTHWAWAQIACWTSPAKDLVIRHRDWSTSKYLPRTRRTRTSSSTSRRRTTL